MSDVIWMSVHYGVVHKICVNLKRIPKFEAMHGMRIKQKISSLLAIRTQQYVKQNFMLTASNDNKRNGDSE